MSSYGTPRRISYVFIAVLLFLVGWLHLATPLLTVLFSFFALTKLRLTESKWMAVGLFLVIMAGLSYIMVFFMGHAYVALPNIASTAIPTLIDFAQQHGFELPFTDVASLKKLALDSLKDEWGSLGKYAKVAAVEIASLIIGLVVAVSLFLNAKWDGSNQHAESNLYAMTAVEISKRFKTFYESFATVMGAQLVISLINTSLTSIFLVACGLPYTMLIIVMTFCCGMLPIIGNLMSNTLIVGVALTVSPKMAMTALTFLIVLHKLEYFLNSKIVGDRIKNPMWLTLLGLVLGERLMGIPGLIFAPVALHYIKIEASRNRVAASTQQDNTAFFEKK